MSMKRFGKGALRIAQQIASRAENLNGTWVLKVVPRLRPFLSPGTTQTVARVVAVPRVPARNPFVRMIQMVIRNQRAIARPFSTLTMNHRVFAGYEQNRIRRPKLLFKRPRRQTGIVERVRDLFGTKERYNDHLRGESLPDRLSEYDIGGSIGYGCNAAVYALRLHSQRQTASSDTRDLKAYPLALKLMYNYEFDTRWGREEEVLWRGMGVELAPLPKATQLLKGKIADFRPLPCKHPNIVHMATAFVDRMPILPDAQERYPEALPTASFYLSQEIPEDPKTMFIVMKRYRITLRDYLRTNRRNLWTSRALLAQLLEGCVFLYHHKVAQRDMKSDNILLSYDVQGEIPSLVISDFGCALATGSFEVDYFDETVDLGGNLSTRAPEITTARPPCRLDFSLADTWAAGTLAYEIFTRENPFYFHMKSATYKEEDLPPLGQMVPSPIRRTVSELLRRDPSERVLPSIAANVLSLSLFRFGADLRDLFKQHALHPVGRQLRKVSQRVERTLDEVVSMLAAETIAARVAPPNLVSRAELQLRATFMSRLQRDELWDSLDFFESSPVETESEYSDSAV